MKLITAIVNPSNWMTFGRRSATSADKVWMSLCMEKVSSKFMSLKLFRSLTVVALIVGFGNTTFADRNAGSAPTRTKVASELKNVLAEMYQTMADCLRSDKSFETCRQEACNCQVLNATGRCPINEQIAAARDR